MITVRKTDFRTIEKSQFSNDLIEDVADSLTILSLDSNSLCSLFSEQLDNEHNFYENIEEEPFERDASLID